MLSRQKADAVFQARLLCTSSNKALSALTFFWEKFPVYSPYVFGENRFVLEVSNSKGIASQKGITNNQKRKS